jgi:hypothetical protein
MTLPRRENGETGRNKQAEGPVYPANRLFTEGLTTDRLMQVVKVLPGVLRQREMPPELIERHGSVDAPVVHDGWPLMRRTVELPGYHPGLLTGGSIMTKALSQTLFLHEDLGISRSGIWLASCTTIQGRPAPIDQILEPDVLIENDTLAKGYGTEMDLSLVTDRVTTRSAGVAITYFAMNRGLIEDLHPFAVADPIDPSQAEGPHPA